MPARLDGSLSVALNALTPVPATEVGRFARRHFRNRNQELLAIEPYSRSLDHIFVIETGINSYAHYGSSPGVD